MKAISFPSMSIISLPRRGLRRPWNVYGNNASEWFCVPLWKDTKIRLSRSYCIKDAVTVLHRPCKSSVPHSPNLGENRPEAGLQLILSAEIWGL